MRKVVLSKTATKRLESVTSPKQSDAITDKSEYFSPVSQDQVVIF